MSNRIRRHVDPFQCRIALSPEDWVKSYSAHGQAETWMDLGCGKGEFLAGLAGLHPEIFFIGVEVRKKVAEKYFPQYQHVANLVLLHGNVNLSIPSMMGDRKVQKVFVHFPDPYSRKDRYKKRRIVNEALVEGLCEILAAGGTVSVKTDDQSLFQDMDALLSLRLEPAPSSTIPSAEATALTEGEFLGQSFLYGNSLKKPLPRNGYDPKKFEVERRICKEMLRTLLLRNPHQVGGDLREVIQPLGQLANRRTPSITSASRITWTNSSRTMTSASAPSMVSSVLM